MPTVYRGFLGGMFFFASLTIARTATAPIANLDSVKNSALGVSAMGFLNGMIGRGIAEFLSNPLTVAKTEMEYSTAAYL